MDANFSLRSAISRVFTLVFFVCIATAILFTCFFVKMASSATTVTPASVHASTTGLTVPVSTDSEDGPSAKATPEEVKDFNSAADLLTKLAQEQDPLAAFHKLQTLSANDPKVAVQCHNLTHVIGDAAYKKYGSFEEAMKYADYMCGSGYIHSLVSNAFKNTQDPSIIVNSICQGQDGYCFHGIGHGLMFYTDNDVPKALSYCAMLDTSEHQARCSEGVFMQNFEPGGDDPTPYVYKDDPLKLCRDEPRYKSGCYIYAAEYLASKQPMSSDAFDLCDVSELAWHNKCVSGMGSYFMAVHLSDPQLVERVCDKAGNANSVSACIDGMVSYHLVNYNSIPKTTELCASMSVADQPACRVALEARKAFYQ
jgi:hypothetical protein